MSYAEDRCLERQPRGGRRPGSGRKKLYRVPVLLRISTQAAKALQLAAKRLEVTPSRVVEYLLLGKTS